MVQSVRRPSVDESSLKSQGSQGSAKRGSFRGMLDSLKPSSLLPSLNDSINSGISIDSQSDIESDIGDSCSLLDEHSTHSKRKGAKSKIKSVLGKFYSKDKEKGRSRHSSQQILSSSVSSSMDSSSMDGSINDPPTICEPESDRKMSSSSKSARRRPRSNTESTDEEALDDSSLASFSCQQQHRKSSRHPTGDNLGRTRSFRHRANNSSSSSNKSHSRKVPGRSKSYDGSRDVGGETGTALPQRASSFAAQERQRNAANRPTNALPSVRPSTSRRNMNPSIAERRQSSQRKRRGVTRAKSFHGHPEGKDARKLPARSQSSTNLNDLSGGSSSRRRSSSRSRRENSSSSAPKTSPQVVCRHGEALGECCYEQANPNNQSSGQLFSLENHFGAEDLADELSIDNTVSDLSSSLSSLLVKGKSKAETADSEPVSDKKEAKDRPRSESRSRSQSRTREQEVGPDGKPRRKRSSSRNRDPRVSRGRTSSSKVQSTERDRSQSKTRRRSASRKRSSSKAATSNRGRSCSRSQKATPHSASRSTSTVRKTNSQTARSRSRSTSNARREGGTSTSSSRKLYETLRKEDIHGKPPDRRPRSLSRTRRSEESTSSSEHTDVFNRRVSRSLSRSREKSARKPEDIGNYLSRQTPECTTDDDGNSQSTGSNTTGSNQFGYKTPSYLWGNNNSMSQSNNSFSLTGKPAISDTSERTATTASSTENSFTFNDASNSTLGTHRTTTSASNKTTSTPNNDPMNLLQVSMSSLSVSASPATKAKHLYGKLVQKEEQILQSLMDEEDKNMDGARFPSMFAPLDH